MYLVFHFFPLVFVFAFTAHLPLESLKVLKFRVSRKRKFQKVFRQGVLLFFNEN